ncbi:MAG: hypothetical protein AB7S26_02785 [Sandaracinaceae bacterium]
MSTRAQWEDDEPVDPAMSAELDAAYDEARLGDNLYIASGVVGGVGVLAILGSSIVLGACAGRCMDDPTPITAATVVLGIGIGLAVLAIAGIILATVFEEEAETRRRRVLREQISLRLVPVIGGAQLAWHMRF